MYKTWSSLLLSTVTVLIVGQNQHSLRRGVPSPPREPIVLWPAGAPGATGVGPVDVPTLTAYLPQGKTVTGSAIIVCPGGGYQHLADHEGAPVAKWLNSIGITGFVLK